MSFTGRMMVPGSRLLKMIAYDRKRHRLRGLRLVSYLSKIALREYPEVKVEKIEFCGLETGKFIPKNISSDKVLLYLHGGGYSVCSWQTHRTMIEALCKLSGIVCYAINYRMAPEHPFPAAIEDASKALDELIKIYGAKKISIGGDSAGGGLAFATLLKHKSEQKELVSNAFAFSPWLDLSVPLYSTDGELNGDPMLDPEAVKIWAERYLNRHNPKDYLASPIYGNTEGLPPFLIHVGEHEMLLNESVNFVSAARDAGVEAHLRIFPDMVHVFQLMHVLVPEARESLKEIAEFISK